MHILSSKYLNCTLLAKTGCGTSLHGPQTSHLPYATAYTVWICYLATATLRTVTRLSWTWKKNRYTYRVFQWFSVAERGAPSSQCVTWATNCTTLVRCSPRSVGDAADSFEFRRLFTPCPRRHWASTFSWRTLNYASFFINSVRAEMLQIFIECYANLIIVVENKSQCLSSTKLLPKMVLSNFPIFSMTVAVPRTLSSFGDRSFATADPRAWNKLPSHLRLMQSADTFRRHVKLHQAFLSWHC